MTNETYPLVVAVRRNRTGEYVVLRQRSNSLYDVGTSMDETGLVFVPMASGLTRDSAIAIYAEKAS